jgi:hypothetical protein
VILKRPQETMTTKGDVPAASEFMMSLCLASPHSCDGVRSDDGSEVQRPRTTTAFHHDHQAQPRQTMSLYAFRAFYSNDLHESRKRGYADLGDTTVMHDKKDRVRADQVE